MVLGFVLWYSAQPVGSIYTSMLSIQVVTLPTVLFRKGARRPHSSGQYLLLPQNLPLPMFLREHLQRRYGAALIVKCFVNCLLIGDCRGAVFYLLGSSLCAC